MGENAKSGTIDFYFDFVSPYGYFASLVIDAFAARHGRRAIWHPMLLGVSVLKVMKLPPLPQRPLMGEYHIRHAIPRYARLHGIVLRRPLDAMPPSPTQAAKCFCLLAATDRPLAQSFAKAVMAAHWRGEEVVDSPEAILLHAAEVGANAAELRGRLDSLDASVLLRSAVNASLDRGVFGSPTFVVDDEPFFGVDSLDMLDLWLKRNGW